MTGKANTTPRTAWHRPPLNTGRQRGAVLIVSLVMLLILTLIAVAGMNTANVQEKMAGNLQDYQVAFEMAEAALRDAEEWFNDMASSPEGTTSPNYASGEVWAQSYLQNSVADQVDWWNDEDNITTTWWRNNGESIDVDGALVRSGPSDDSWYVWEQPRWVVESVGSTSGPGSQNANTVGSGSQAGGYTNVYRVVARGVGGRENTVVLLEVMFGKQ